MDREIKLGSLFDGSGGFPLAGVLHGIRPVWASEIEPFPIRVTKNRFPQMKHLGSVTDVNGAEIEPVDIITFGSPCQDLSVAGKQKGIHDGERSNLFFEAIRIIKEMRNATANEFPRFAVWENVPGAFSSNKGEDFRAVLQAFCEAAGSGIHVPMPEKNKWAPAGCVVGDGFSVAWRVYDAQYWGVPQRRKRIYLIADFRSERAGEILFESEGVSGHSQPGGKAREGTPEDVEGSAGGSDSVRCLNPWDCQSKRQYSIDGVYRTLDAGESSGGQAHGVCYALDSMSSNSMKSQNPNSGFHEESVVKTLDTNPDPTCNQGGNVIVETVAIEGNTVDRNSKKNGCGYCEGRSPTLNTQDRHAVCFQCSGDRKDPSVSTSDKAYCLPANPMSDRQQAVCFQQNQRDEVRSMGEQAGALTAEPGVHNQNYLCYPEKARSLCARHDSSPCVDRGQNVVAIGMTNRGYESGDVTETIRAECHNAHPIVCYEGQNLCTDEKTAFALQAGRPDDHHIPALCVQNTGRGWWNEGDTAETLRTPCGGDSTKANLVVERVQQDAVCFVPEQNHQRTFRQGEIAATLQTRYHAGSGGDAATVVYDCRGNGDGETCPTVTGDHNNRVTDFSAVAVKRIENE